MRFQLHEYCSVHAHSLWGGMRLCEASWSTHARSSMGHSFRLSTFYVLTARCRPAVCIGLGAAEAMLPTCIAWIQVVLAVDFWHG